MESFNRKPKDHKRLSKGFSNFDYVRQRILWSTRYISFSQYKKLPKHNYIDKSK